MIPTPHISATKEDFAKVMLMPGDPMRSKYVAEKFLENPRLVNNIRGVQGYTGTFEGKPVSVMASGMGIPSMSLYSYELFNEYDLDAIIRIGTIGLIQPDLKVGQVLLADCAYTDSDFYKHCILPENYFARADEGLLKKAEEAAKDLEISFRTGPVLTQEIYYSKWEGNKIENWVEKGVMGFEMEAAALYANAQMAGKKALAVLTSSNNILTGEEMDPMLRESALDEMILIALKTAIA